MAQDTGSGAVGGILHHPEVFGRAVVGAVYEATSHFLVDPDVDLEALIRGLCAIFAPET